MFDDDGIDLGDVGMGGPNRGRPSVFDKNQGDLLLGLPCRRPELSTNHMEPPL